MVSMRSSDRGASWTPLEPIEPYSNLTTGQVSAYGSVAARPDGTRVFAYWIQNVNNVSHVPGKVSTCTAKILINILYECGCEDNRSIDASR